MILSHSMNEEDLAEAIVTGSDNYEEVVKLFGLIDDQFADSVFTDMVVGEFFKREQAINRGDAD